MTLKVGLTGGIGSGKSSAVDGFRALGITIIDADQIAKSIVAPGESALQRIADCFGAEILLSNGELNRKALKDIVFNDPEALKKLENILHPQIRLEIENQISRLESEPYIIIDIPLLVEKNYQKILDYIIVVDCLPEQQIERVRQRDKLNDASIQTIMQTQASREDRNKAATHILDNSSNKASLLEQIKTLHDTFLRLSKQ